MPRLLPRLLAAFALFVVLVALCVRNYYPPLPNPFTVDLTLDRAAAGVALPLVVSGQVASGDFLFVRHVDDTHVTFGYDSWARPGITSTAVRFTPGVPLRLVFELPAFTALHDNLVDTPGHLRVTVAGSPVLDTPVDFYPRKPSELWLATNPLGGTSCGPQLVGRLSRPDGRELRGGVAAFLTLSERLAGWVRHGWQIYGVVFLCGAVALGWIPLAWCRPAAWRNVPATLARALRAHRWFVGSTAVCTLIFGWMITQGSFHFFSAEPFTSFYDYQLSALLHGRLDVPEAAVGGEAFVFGGKLYGYFGPTPSLLRLPLALFGFAFGELSRVCMVAYFVAGLTACYLLLRHAVRLAGGTAPSAWAVVVLLGHVGLGSTFFFLGSRAYIYHEAILCGAVFALFSCYFALRHLQPVPAPPPGRPPRWWLWALVCGLLALHARAPAGLFSLTFLGCVSVAHLFRGTPPSRSRQIFLLRHLCIGALCVVGMLTFNGLSYLKFATFDGAPLRYSRPYDAARLAKIDGKNFHAANLPSGAYTYLVRPNLRVEKGFPWLYLGADTPGHHFPRAKLDFADNTLAITFGLPGLFLLASFGCAAAFFRVPALRSEIFVTWAAAGPMSLALFAAIATAHRYTGDFVPFLVVGAVLGLAALEQCPARLRTTFRFTLGVVTLFAIGLTFALTLHHQREMVWGVPESARQDYQALRSRIDRTLFPTPATLSP